MCTMKIPDIGHSASQTLLFCRHFPKKPKFFILFFFRIRTKICASMQFDMISRISRGVLKAWSCSIFRFLKQVFESTLLYFEVKTPPISYETSSFSTNTLKLVKFTVFFA